MRKKEKPIEWSFKFRLTITLNEGNMKFIIARFLEPSSWAGIGLLITGLDNVETFGLNPTTIGMVLTALVAIFMPGKVIADAPPDKKPWPSATKFPPENSD